MVMVSAAGRSTLLAPELYYLAYYARGLLCLLLVLHCILPSASAPFSQGTSQDSCSSARQPLLAAGVGNFSL